MLATQTPEEARQARLFYWGLLSAIALLLATLIAAMGWQAAWEIWNIPVMQPEFADMRTITGGAQTHAMGLDPLLQNPGDPWGRPMSYPRVWQLLFLFDLDDSHVYLLAGVMLLGFVVGLLTFSDRLDEISVLVLALAILSPAALLGIERANNDLLVFGLLGLALFAFRQGRDGLSIGLILSATVLKLFPVFALAIFWQRRSSPEVRRLLAMAAVALAFYLALSLPDLQLIHDKVLKGTYLSFGKDVLASHLAAVSPELATTLRAWALPLLLALPIVAWLVQRRWNPGRLGEGEDGRVVAFIAGAAIYLGSFLLGHNWDYRLIFLLLTLPLLVSAWRHPERALRIPLRLALVLVLVSLWSMLAVHWIEPGPGFDRYLWFDELANWSLYGCLAWLLVALLRDSPQALARSPGAGSPMPALDALRGRLRPIHLLVLILLVWVLAAVVNLHLHLSGVQLDTPILFPFSSYLPRLNLAALHHGLVFLLALFVLLRYHAGLGAWQLWLGGVVLLVSGNLIQGGFDAAFVQPFTLTDYQYYHDAIRIHSPLAWLSAFNEQQPQLLMHTRTHPPFAVLLHLPFLPAHGQDAHLLGIAFTLMASLSLPLLFRVAMLLDARRDRAVLLTLLFACLPAFNIFALVSLDGVILTASLLVMLGVARIWRDGLQVTGVALLAIGMLLVNLLTFAGTFWVLLTSFLAWWLWRREGSCELALALAAALALGVLVLVALQLTLDYNHVEAFLTASRLENPEGPAFIVHPAEYLMTRVKGVLELVIFASLPVAAWLLWRGVGWRYDRPLHPVESWGLMGALVLGLMLITGAFRTGETARACLFAYPLLLLQLLQASRPRLVGLGLAAGAQTLWMQATGFWFW